MNLCPYQYPLHNPVGVYCPNSYHVQEHFCPNSYPVQSAYHPTPYPCCPQSNFQKHEDLCNRHQDPEEVFREFFGSSIFDFMGEDFPLSRRGDRERCSRGGGRRGHRSAGGGGHEVSIFGPLGGGGFFEGFFSSPRGGYNCTTMQSSLGVHDNHPTSSYIRQVSTSTKVINGKKMTTKRIYENGKEVVMSYENDVLTSKTVNGVPQSIKYVEH